MKDNVYLLIIFNLWSMVGLYVAIIIIISLLGSVIKLQIIYLVIEVLRDYY
jgi:hypothetical protein